MPITGDLVANNGDALLAAAVAGQGIIYQPHFIVAEAVAQGQLVVLELDKPLVELGGITCFTLQIGGHRLRCASCLIIC